MNEQSKEFLSRNGLLSAVKEIVWNEISQCCAPCVCSYVFKTRVFVFGTLPPIAVSDTPCPMCQGRIINVHAEVKR